ncbi:VOC family protein [Roseibium sp.]|uniref:VOC family protein n=1 Tax=Roseibium sp. TaxID=1936156 RepID=UPI003D0C57B7
MASFLNHVAWVVEDQQAAINFLVTHFGCEAGPPRVISGAWAEELAQIKGVHVTYVGVTSPGTETRIALLKFVTPPSEPNNSVDVLYLKGFRHIGFLVDDIDAKKSELEAAGFKFFSDVVTVDSFNSRTVYFRGPERVVVQLTEQLSS